MTYYYIYICFCLFVFRSNRQLQMDRQGLQEMAFRSEQLRDQAALLSLPNEDGPDCHVHGPDET